MVEEPQCFSNGAVVIGKVEDFVQKERQRQLSSLQLVASENLPTARVAAIERSAFLSWKTVEGPIGERYHAGCEVFDEIEAAALAACSLLYGCRESIVQVITNSAANLAVARALDERGAVMAYSARSGGHVSHARYPREVVTIEVDPQTKRIDVNALREQLAVSRPAALVVGGSSYPRRIGFEQISAVCREYGVVLWADCAHLAGLVAAGLEDDVCEHCDVITGSTYKTLRGPRSGFLLMGNHAEAKHGRKLLSDLRRAVFPNSHSSINGTLLAAKAVCFEEAANPAFRVYASQVVENAKTFAGALEAQGIGVVTGGTDTHIVLCDLRPQDLSGQRAEMELSRLQILANRNQIPFDPLPPAQASGVRFGTAFLTSRGFDREDFQVLGALIGRSIVELSRGSISASTRRRISELVHHLNSTKPIPAELIS